jgi:Poly (ADP-ribose) glycohydrolase (PARG)
MKLFQKGGLQLCQHFQHVGTPLEFAQQVGETNFVPGTALQYALESMLDESLFQPFLESLLSSATNLDDNFDANSDLNLEAAHVVFQRGMCRGFLAQTFLGNLAVDPVKHLKPWGSGLDFNPMFWSSSSVAVEKTKCLIQYFLSTNDLQDHDDDVHFERMSVPDASLLQWDRLVDKARVVITVDAMETSESDAIIDFANEVYGVGCFLPDSMTQEEILQMCCPEMNVGMLFHGTIPDNQVCIIRNAGRYAQYKGYLSSFRFCGPQDPVYYQDILVMDACTPDMLPFSSSSVKRDILKAYTTFSNAANLHIRQSEASNHIIISTGKWGCGAFGGDPVFKFLQQVVAVCLCTDSRRLRYSAYGNTKELKLFERVLDAVHGVPCKDILEVMRCRDLFRTQDNYDNLVTTLSKVQHRDL